MNKSFSWNTIGIPAPQGSKRHVGNGRLIESCKALKPWREQCIADSLSLSIPTIHGPVSISLVFRFQRPKSHYNSKGQLKPSAPQYKTSKPDIDKLARAILDSLTLARVIQDDAQCFLLTAQKRFCVAQEPPGVMITVMDLEHEAPCDVV